MVSARAGAGAEAVFDLFASPHVQLIDYCDIRGMLPQVLGVITYRRGVPSRRVPFFPFHLDTFYYIHTMPYPLILFVLCFSSFVSSCFIVGFAILFAISYCVFVRLLATVVVLIYHCTVIIQTHNCSNTTPLSFFTIFATIRIKVHKYG